MLGNIFNIQRFCVHDGPGVRTVLFFKGCPLHCLWCCNPESQSTGRELMFDGAKCILCGGCASACPEGAIKLSDNGPDIDRVRCTLCAGCVEACPSTALNISGREISAQEAAELILRDKDYYAVSGGGVTFSGGEASMQAEFITELAYRLKKEGINLTLETCGVCPEDKFAELVKNMDTVLFDIKLLDGEKFRQYTGGELGTVLRNLKAAAVCPDLHIRVPLIPGVNMDEGFYRELGRLADSMPVSAIELLPYHRLGENKYRQLGREAWYTELAPLEENLSAFEAISASTTVKVKLC